MSFEFKPAIKAFGLTRAVHHQVNLILMDQGWVHSYLSSSDQMTTYARYLFAKVDDCRRFLNTDFRLGCCSTTLLAELNELGRVLKDNMMTMRYYPIFKRVVLEEFA